MIRNRELLDTKSQNHKSRKSEKHFSKWIFTSLLTFFARFAAVFRFPKKEITEISPCRKQISEISNTAQGNYRERTGAYKSANWPISRFSKDIYINRCKI